MYVTMDTVKAKCPTFEGGKTCPYIAPGLNGLADGCPEFKNGCPFKGVKDVGELKQKMGEMRDKHHIGKGVVNSDKALKVMQGSTADIGLPVVLRNPLIQH